MRWSGCQRRVGVGGFILMPFLIRIYEDGDVLWVGGCNELAPM